MNLVGLTIVVIAVNFLSVIFEAQEINLAIYGIGYALPTAALAYFMKVRSQVKGNENERAPFTEIQTYKNENEAVEGDELIGYYEKNK